MRIWPWLAGVASLQGCLLGVFDSSPPPAFVGDPVVLEPSAVGPDGIARARAGTRVVVEFVAATPLALHASRVVLGGAELACAAAVGRARTYTCETTLTGDELEGRARLSAELVDARGTASATDRSGEILLLDFSAPSGGCVLSPTSARSGSTMGFLVVASEDLLGGVPVVSASDDRLQVEHVDSVDRRHRFTVSGPDGVDLPGFVLTVAARDLAGNPHTGESLCDRGDRTGNWFGSGPRQTGEAMVAVEPMEGDPAYVDPAGGVPWARSGARVTVTLPTAEAVDTDASLVALSGVPLTPVEDTSGTWSIVLTGDEGDGLKDLDARLFDGAGNPLHVQAPGVVGFDFTPPSVATAILQRAPFLSSADDGSGTVAFTHVDPLTGGRVEATLRIWPTEELGVPAVLDADPTNPGPVSWIPQGDGVGFSTWSLDAVPSGADGDYRFTVDLADRVGNVAHGLPVDVTLVVDTETPAALTTDAPDAIVFTREPWGASSTTGTPRVAIDAVVGTATPGTLVVVETPRGVRLATTIVAPDGGFGVALGVDTPDVRVRQHDRAGNPSPAARVRDVSWTATATAGAVDAPLTLREVPAATDALSAWVADEAALPVDTTAGRPWLPWLGNQPTGTTPSARTAHALAHDAARGVTVLFGGTGSEAGACGSPGDPECADTWEWDGTVWREIATTPSPPARYDHALAYDAARGVVVLFGGRGIEAGACGTPGDVRCSDTWEWDGATWMEVTAPSSPAARFGHALAYDAARGVTVLVGGNVATGGCGGTGGGTCFDTWTWDGARWTDVTPASTPRPRSSHALAYDVARGVTVLFGGNGSGTGVCGPAGQSRCSDTWTWDGEAWTEVATAIAPPARDSHALAYDATRGVTVLYGGFASGCAASGADLCEDTWEWDGAAWREITAPGRPPGRTSPALAYDIGRRVTVLFGGHAFVDGACGTQGSTRCSDTWERGAGGWSEPRLAVSPSPRSAHAVAYDAARDVTVLFGGRDANEVLGDTWEWDGMGWTERSPAVGPPARENHALAYDLARGVTVLFGGRGAQDGACGTVDDPACSDTWEWDGSSWSPIATSTAPPPRHDHAMAYDASRGVAVVFGGIGVSSGSCGASGTFRCADTWTWDGAAWRDMSPLVSPVARVRHAMAYDADRGVVVLFGGTDISVRNACGRPGGSKCFDTWEWDGAAWTEALPPDSPPARESHGLAHDPLRGVLVLHGGNVGSLDGACGSAAGVFCADTWTWDGVTWRELSPALLPPARSGVELAYDVARSATLSVGGVADPGGRISAVWRLPSDAAEAPRHEAAGAFFVPAGASGASVRSITVRWTAGGSGVPGGSQQTGAELVVWDGFGWSVLDSHTANDLAPAELCTRLVADPTAPGEPGCSDLVDPILVRGLYRFGSEGTATFAVRPVAPIGVDTGRLRSEDVAVTVRYRLPPG